MSAPTIFWSYDGTTEDVGTRSYANQESGTATTFSSLYVVWNTGGVCASNCSFYLADVQGVHISDENVLISFGTVDFTRLGTVDSVSVADLDSNGATNASTVSMYEQIEVETDDVVGTREWSKNITYQYS